MQHMPLGTVEGAKQEDHFKDKNSSKPFLQSYSDSVALLICELGLI